MHISPCTQVAPSAAKPRRWPFGVGQVLLVAEAMPADAVGNSAEWTSLSSRLCSLSAISRAIPNQSGASDAVPADEQAASVGMPLGLLLSPPQVLAGHSRLHRAGQDSLQ